MHRGFDLEALIDCIIGFGITIQSTTHVAKNEALEKQINNMFLWICNEKKNLYT